MVTPDDNNSRRGSDDQGGRIASTPSAGTLTAGSLIACDDEAYDIRIAADGTWYYCGSPINRLGLVKLFASVLRRDAAGDHWLITPAERGRIRVDDAPFVAVGLVREGAGRDQRLTFTTNLGETVVAGPDHPITVREDPGGGGPRPYVSVRGGMRTRDTQEHGGRPQDIEALISRPVYYELVNDAIEDQGGLGVWSQGAFFPLAPVA